MSDYKSYGVVDLGFVSAIREPPHFLHDEAGRDTGVRRMIYLGIDPGKQGAVAILGDPMLHRVADTTLDSAVVHPLPGLGDGKSWELDAQSLNELIPADAEIFACVEKQQPMPKNGSISAFKSGKTYGSILAVLQIAGVRYECVSPATWKKAMLGGLDRSDKASSIVQARRLFPGVSLKRTDKCRTDDHNFAEALLLAEYARRMNK